MISGNPSYKCQRFWIQIRPTVDTSICTELKRLISMGFAVACSSSHARVQEFLSGKLQVCKVLGGDPLHLLISMETYMNYGFQGDEGPDPLPSFGSAHASLKLS